MNNPLDGDDTAPGQVRPQQAQPVPQSSPQPSPQPGDTPIADKPAEPKGARAGKTRKRPPWLLIGGAIVVLLAIAGVVGWKFGAGLFQAPIDQMENARKAEEPKGPLKGYVKGSIAHLVTLEQPQTIANIPFVDRDKKQLHLSDFKGKVVILNVWATWCAPCRFEMPTLAHLQTMYANKDVKVLPLSVDTEEKFDDVKSFMDVQDPLEVYADPNFAAPSKFGISGMPATLILDKQGREVARLDGEATWDTPEVKALVDRLLAQEQ